MLQTLAAALMALGVTAAFKSHTLKRPTPMANLYSPHSYLGMLVLVLFTLQVWPHVAMQRLWHCFDVSDEQELPERMHAPPACPPVAMQLKSKHP